MARWRERQFTFFAPGLVWMSQWVRGLAMSVALLLSVVRLAPALRARLSIVAKSAWQGGDACYQGAGYGRPKHRAAVNLRGPRLKSGMRRPATVIFSVSPISSGCGLCTAFDSSPFPAFSPGSTRRAVARPYYRLPLARLWVMQSIWQFLAELSPPLLHAATWSASISSNL